jgi:hypothetical protein
VHKPVGQCTQFICPMASFAKKEKTAAEVKKIQSAEAQLREAKKCLTTSMFQWKKDYLSAGPLYMKAANDFRVAKEPERAIEALVNASKCSQECGMLHEVGNSFQQAAMIAKTLKTKEGDAQTASFFEQAFDAFCANDDCLTATNAGKQAALILARSDAPRAISMYRKLLDMLEAQQKHTYAFEIYRDVVRLCVRSEDFATACELVKNAVEAFKQGGQMTTVYQWHLCEVVLLVHRGDRVGADEAFLNSLGTQGYGLSDQAAAAEEFLKGVKDNDGNKLSTVKNMPGLRYVPVPDIGAIAMKICDEVISGSSAPLTKAPASDHATTKAAMDEVAALGSAISDSATRMAALSVGDSSRRSNVGGATEENGAGDPREATRSSLDASIAETNDLLADMGDEFDDLA